MTTFMKRVQHAKQAQELLNPYGLSHSFRGSILDSKLPAGGEIVKGVVIGDIVICDASEFLDKNPIISTHLNQKRHEIIELFQAEQEEARAWHNRPILKAV
jgi:hypothetical protein